MILGPDPAAGLMVILILILIEGILSVDNAAVLATMVMKLPPEQRGKALRYGILGAYLFRGICLVGAAWLITIWWLEPLGGLYLLWLAYSHFFGKKTDGDEMTAESSPRKSSWLMRYSVNLLGPFWSTVCAIEIMDLAFSIDNVVAAVAYVKNFPMPSKLILVCTGVFLGILAMRFAAKGFVVLMEKFAFLETCAFLVIGLLGVKLLLSVPRHFLGEGNPVHDFLASKGFDIGASLLTLLIFVVPVLLHWIKNRKTLDPSPGA